MSAISISDFPAQITLDIYQGDTVTRDVTIREDGSLVDVSADAFSMRIIDGRGTVLHTLAIGTGIAHVSTGKVRFTITAAQTEAFTAAKVVTDFEWTRASDGRVKTLFRSSGKVITDVTP